MELCGPPFPFFLSIHFPKRKYVHLFPGCFVFVARTIIMEAQGKQKMETGKMVKRLADFESDNDGGYEQNTEEDDYNSKNKKKSVVIGGVNRKGSSGDGGAMRCCQAEKCTADLSDAKRYHKRHKVCEHHAKAQVVLVTGLRQRFCQQCSRFHELSEFDKSKRSCRSRLAGHNERRRKNSAESQSEGSGLEGTGTQ